MLLMARYPEPIPCDDYSLALNIKSNILRSDRLFLRYALLRSYVNAVVLIVVACILYITIQN